MDARVTYVGKTSLEVSVRVLAEDPVAGTVTHTNSAYLVYVALDDDLRPTAVPALIPETEEERVQYEAGRERQAKRTAKA